MFFKRISETGYPGMPVIEDAVMAPTATTFEIETFFRRPAHGYVLRAAALAQANEDGRADILIWMSDTMTCSRVPPSTV